MDEMDRQQQLETEQYIQRLIDRDPERRNTDAVFAFLGNHFRSVRRPEGPGLPAKSLLTSDPPMAKPESTRFFVEGLWKDVEPHLARLATAIPNATRETASDPWSPPSLRITTDSELISRKFGRQDDDEPAFLSWVVTPELLVIRTQQRTGNEELPNLLLEVLEAREPRTNRQLYTVLVNDPTACSWFQRVAYSTALNKYLERMALHVEIFPDGTATQV